MQRWRMWGAVVLLLAALLAGCGGAATTSFTSVNSGLDGGGDFESAPSAPMPTAAAAAGGAAPREPAADNNGSAEQPASGSGNPITAGMQTDPNRKIIKNGDLTLEVENATIALNRITGIATQLGGYTVEIRSAGQEGQGRTATVSFAVPVDRFEDALERVRGTAKRVLGEQASGQDVSEEFVDVQSQIGNLEATQARVRTFLEQAKTVEEALRVNTQLTELEGQISQLKGRLQFLNQRAAFSTITVAIQEVPPPTPTAKATLTPTPDSWVPRETINDATGTLEELLQGLASIVIWVVIVGGPFLLPIAIVWWIYSASRRRRAAPKPNQPSN